MYTTIKIRNGRVIDPARGHDGIEDILVHEGKIVDAASFDGAALEVDATGCLVTPGLIDFHTHIFSDASDLCTFPQASMLAAGVTAAVDPGSAGTANMDCFMASMLTEPMMIKAFMHVCPTGLGTVQFHEEIQPDKWDVPTMGRLLEKYKDSILGLKIRLSKELVHGDAKALLEKVIALAERFGVAVCVHTTNPALAVNDLLDMLRPGDIFCHVFHGKGETVCPDGVLNEKVFEAQQRGIIFDAANGGNHFAFDTAIPALKAGFFPDVISTDLTSKTLWKEPVMALPYLMSKYVALGASLMDIVRATTSNPAQYMNLEGKIGTLVKGARGDIAIFKQEERDVTFKDSFAKTIQGKSLLVPQMTICGGALLYRNLSLV